MGHTRLYPRDKVFKLRNNFYKTQRVWLMKDDNHTECEAIIARVEKRSSLNVVWYHLEIHTYGWNNKIKSTRKMVVTEEKLFPYVPKWELWLNRLGIYRKS